MSNINVEKNKKRVGVNSFLLLVMSMMSIVVCTTCLAGSSWAWFTSSQSVNVGSINASTYTVETTIVEVQAENHSFANETSDTIPSDTDETTPNETEIKVDPVEGGYILEAGKEYDVTLTATGDAKAGYCILDLGGEKLYTEIFAKDAEANNTNFKLRLERAAKLKIEPNWGSYDAAKQPNVIKKDATYTLGSAAIRFESEDGHELIVNNEGTAVLDGKYNFTRPKNVNHAKGDVLEGIVNGKKVTVYKINNGTYALWNDIELANAVADAPEESSTNQTTQNNQVIYGGTVFTGQVIEDKMQVVDSPKTIEVWRGDKMAMAFNDLQKAVNFAVNDDVIKLTEDIVVQSGVYIKGKKIIIEGKISDNTDDVHVLDRTNWANPVFYVAENAQLVINNLTIDGGNETARKNTSAIVSFGSIEGNNLNIINNYTGNEGESPLKIAFGKGKFINCTFTGNSVKTDGKAVNIGSKYLDDRIAAVADDANRKALIIADVVFEKCIFCDNISLNIDDTDIFVATEASVKLTTDLP